MLKSDEEIASLLRELSSTVHVRPDLVPTVAQRGEKHLRRRRLFAVGGSLAVLLGATAAATSVYEQIHKNDTGAVTIASKGSTAAPPTDSRLLDWPTRGNKADDSGFAAQAVNAQNGNPNADRRIVGEAHLLFAGNVPGASAAVIEGVNSHDQVVVAALATAPGQPDGALDVIDARVTSDPLPQTDMRDGISFAVSHPALPGFVVVVGAPGTSDVEFSLTPGPTPTGYGPEFQKLQSTNGIASTELPPQADLTRMFYAVTRPGHPTSYSYTMFGGVQ